MKAFLISMLALAASSRLVLLTKDDILALEESESDFFDLQNMAVNCAGDQVKTYRLVNGQCGEACLRADFFGEAAKV